MIFCESVHIEARIPTAFFSHVVGLDANPCYPMAAHVDASVDAGDASPSRLWLIGVLWSSSSVDEYPERESDGFNVNSPHYGKFSHMFCSEIPQSPVPCLLYDVPEYRALMPSLPIGLQEHTCLCFDLPVDLRDEWSSLSHYFPDRVTLWAIDDFGRSRFQLHGLDLPSNRRLEPDETLQAFALQGRLVVRFEPGHLLLVFLIHNEAEVFLGRRLDTGVS